MAWGRHKTWETGNCQPGLHCLNRNCCLIQESFLFKISQFVIVFRGRVPNISQSSHVFFTSFLYFYLLIYVQTSKSIVVHSWLSWLALGFWLARIIRFQSMFNQVLCPECCSVCLSVLTVYVICLHKAQKCLDKVFMILVLGLLSCPLLFAIWNSFSASCVN